MEQVVSSTVICVHHDQTKLVNLLQLISDGLKDCSLCIRRFVPNVAEEPLNTTFSAIAASVLKQGWSVLFEPLLELAVKETAQEFIFMSMFMFMFIHGYVQRERERDRQTDRQTVRQTD